MKHAHPAISRWLVASCLACAALLASALATAAILGGPPEAIRIEVDGVDRAMADNVRAYLSLTRYVQRDDLTDGQVQTSRRPRRGRGSGRVAPLWLLRSTGAQPHHPRRRHVDRQAAHQARRAGVDARGGRFDHRPGKQGPGDRPRRDGKPAAARDAAGPHRLREAEEGPGTNGSRARIPGRDADTARIAGGPAGARGGHSPAARYRRPLRIRQGDDRAGRDRPEAAAGLHPVHRGPAVLGRAHPQHPVRTRGQLLLFERDGHAGRARPGDADGAGHDPRRAHQARSLRRERGLRHGHRAARAVQVGPPAGERLGSPLVVREHGLKRARRRPSHAT